MSHNLYDEFVKIAQQYPDHTVFKNILNNELHITHYSELIATITKYQTALLAYKLMPGNRVALLAPTSSDWVIAYFACLSLKLTVVCLDPGLHPDQLTPLIQQSNIHLLITTQTLFSTFPLSLYANTFVLDIHQGDNCLFAPNQQSIHIADEDPAIANILFTSGTTGQPKGVVLTHEALWQAATLCIEQMQVTSADNVLCLLPAHHVYTLVNVILDALLMGASITFVEKLESACILNAMQKGKPTILIGVPRIYEALTSKIQHEINNQGPLIAFASKYLIIGCAYIRKYTQFNLGHLLFAKIRNAFGGNMNLLISGAAPLAPNIFNMLFGLGFQILEGYGLTETCSCVTVNPLSKQKTSSVGKTIRKVEIKIHAPNAAGVGEIWIRSPTLMQGYLYDQASTDSVLNEGWYHTGDLGYFDKQGYLYIKGRIKELIVLSCGKKVSPYFVESFLNGVPGVEDYAVVGIPNKKTYGEDIHLALVMHKNSDQHTSQQIIKNEITNRQMKMPKWCKFTHIHFIEYIPKTTTLKVKRKELIEHLGLN